MFADDKLEESKRAREEFLSGRHTRELLKRGWSDDVCTMPFAGPVWLKTDRGHAIVGEHIGFGQFRQIGVRPNKYKPMLNTHRTIFITEIVAWRKFEIGDDGE